MVAGFGSSPNQAGDRPLFSLSLYQQEVRFKISELDLGGDSAIASFWLGLNVIVWFYSEGASAVVKGAAQ
jgi:hypothetical protein